MGALSQIKLLADRLVSIPPQPAWMDATKIVSFDPWGRLVPVLKEETLDILPSIAVTKAHLKMSELDDATRAICLWTGRKSPPATKADGSISEAYCGVRRRSQREPGCGGTGLVSVRIFICGLRCPCWWICLKLWTVAMTRSFWRYRRNISRTYHTPRYQGLPPTHWESYGVYFLFGNEMKVFDVVSGPKLEIPMSDESKELTLRVHDECPPLLP